MGNKFNKSLLIVDIDDIDVKYEHRVILNQFYQQIMRYVYEHILFHYMYILCMYDVY